MAVATGLAAMAMLSSCQVRPLYSESGGVGQRLSSVGFSDPKSRIDQVVRNNLIFLASGGAGESARPEYEVKLSTASTASSILDITSDDDTVSVTNTPIAGRVEVQVTYSLSRVRDGQVLKSATREVVSQIDVSSQSFAKLRAIRDAENRAAREAAEFIRAEIAIVLAREPQPQTVWQK